MLKIESIERNNEAVTSSSDYPWNQEHSDHSDKTFYPHHYFDYVAGTSTGGYVKCLVLRGIVADFRTLGCQLSCSEDFECLLTKRSRSTNALETRYSEKPDGFTRNPSYSRLVQSMLRERQEERCKTLSRDAWTALIPGRQSEIGLMNHSVSGSINGHAAERQC